MGQWLAAAEAQGRDPQSKGMAAALRLAFARELGLPLTAASELHVIDGRLTLGALLLRALAERKGYRVKPEEWSAASCTAVICDEAGQELGRSTYTIEMAKQAGLVKDRGGYVKTPERMMWARAATNAIRDYAPEVAVGLLVSEEIAELVNPDDPEGGAESAPPATPPAAGGTTPTPYTGGTGRSYEPDPPDYDPAGDPADPANLQEAEGAEPVEAEPWTDKQRRTIYAILGELDARFAPPLAPEGVAYADWKSVAVDTIGQRYDRNSLSQLREPEADDLIKRMRVRLEELAGAEADRAAEAAREVGPEGGDIPY
jgi:hypothetical protein